MLAGEGLELLAVAATPAKRRPGVVRRDGRSKNKWKLETPILLTPTIMTKNTLTTAPSLDLVRARTVLEAEAEAIRAIQLDDNFLRAVEMLRKCKGKVITTGMGKVGIIAAKMATTLSSTGTPACFLHPGEAAHGDLGLVSKNDVMITFSNSGKTWEW